MTPTHEPSKRPLSDAEFDALDYVVISDARKIQADARYHRARVRELERERDHLRGMVDECEAALTECKHEDEELSELRRQVEAARTALDDALADFRVLRDHLTSGRLDYVENHLKYTIEGMTQAKRAALAGTEVPQ